MVVAKRADGVPENFTNRKLAEDGGEDVDGKLRPRRGRAASVETETRTSWL